MPPRQISFEAMIYPHLKGQITLHLLWSQIMAQTFQQVTVPPPFPLQQKQHFQKAHTTFLILPPQQLMPLWLMDAPIATSAMAHPTGIVAPHPTLATSPTDVTCNTNPWNRVNLTPATHTALCRKHSQERSHHI